MNTIRINLVILAGFLALIAWLCLDLAANMVIETSATVVPLEFVTVAATCVGGVVYCAKRLSENVKTP